MSDNNNLEKHARYESKDNISDKLNKIKELLPNCFVDGQFNEEIFKNELGLIDEIENNERYGFN